ncbi:MAG: hypothetical protein J0H15_12260 [Xanthomonadales bacterium]|nr:hypothetical protein [Xanthomonadales bacterium]
MKRFFLRVALYLAAIIGGTIATVLIIAAFPWLPGASFLVFLVIGFLSGIVLLFALLSRVFWWV